MLSSLIGLESESCWVILYGIFYSSEAIHLSFAVFENGLFDLVIKHFNQ